MQKFGIEIRKIGNTQSLFSEVDLVLKKSGMIEQGQVSDVAKVSTVAHALHKMMQPDRWCDICAIQECSKLCGICISSERMLVYRSHHCMHWNEMLPDHRQMLVAMILDDFRAVLCP